MKKKIIFAPLIGVLILVSLISPVLACGQQKIAVTAVTSGQTNSAPEKEWTTEGGIMVKQGITRTGSVRLTMNGVSIVGALTEIATVFINTNNGNALVFSKKVVFAFATGSFEGVKTATETGVNPTTQIPQTLKQYAILQGSGAYKGQTLVLTQEWTLTTPPAAPIYEGYILIR
jgi:hypothetical protein